MTLRPQAWHWPNFVIPNTIFNKKILAAAIGTVGLLGSLTYAVLTNQSKNLIADAQKYYEAGQYQTASHKLQGAESYLSFASAETRPLLACQIQVYRGAIFAHQQQPAAAIDLLANQIENCQAFPELVAFAQATLEQRSQDLLTLSWQAHDQQNYPLVLSHADEARPYLAYLPSAIATETQCQLTSLQGAAFSHLGQPTHAIQSFQEATALCDPKMQDFAKNTMLGRVQTLQQQAQAAYGDKQYESVLKTADEAEPYFQYLGHTTFGEPYCELVSLKGAAFYEIQQYNEALPIFAMAIARCQSFQSSMQRAHLNRSHIYRQQADQLWTDRQFATSQERYRQALTDLNHFGQYGGHLDAQGLMQRSTMKLRLGDLVGSIRDYDSALKLNQQILRQFYDSETISNFEPFANTPPNLGALLNLLEQQNVRLAVAQLPEGHMGTFGYRFTYWSDTYQIINASAKITIDIYQHDHFLQFINTLHHEAIHVAQTCKANYGRPYGFKRGVPINPKYHVPLFLYPDLERLLSQHYETAELPLEREAYLLSWEPNTALEMVKKHCQ
ncbi:hypothetical protein [Thermosynechococcus sp. FA-CM-4201]